MPQRNVRLIQHMCRCRAALKADAEIGVRRAVRYSAPNGTGRSPQQRHAAHAAAHSTYILWRTENVGMGLGSHNVTLSYIRSHAGGLRWVCFPVQI